jgi:hypothetical protein
MPDLTGFPALDVAIGLAFLFFLLSTISSAVNEGIAAFFGWRAKTLEDAIASLVGDVNGRRTVLAWFGDLISGLLGLTRKKPPPRKAGDPLAGLAHDVLDHWSVRALVRDPNSPLRRRSRPSYLPHDVFSLALAEVLATRVPRVNAAKEKQDLASVPESEIKAASTPWQLGDEALLAAVQKVIADLPDEFANERAFLTSAAVAGEQSLESFRKEVEAGFDDTMTRASGWYKRKAQLMILLIATVITLALNVSTVRVATRLWNDEPLRTTVTAAAIKAVNEAGPTGPTGATGPTGTASAGAAGAGQIGTTGPTGATGCEPAPDDPSTPANVGNCIAFQANRAGDAINKVESLNLPIGWSGPGNRFKDIDISVVGGWLLTIIALSLGAPFWFDLLNKLVRLRGTGVPEGPDTSGSVGNPKPALVETLAEAPRSDRLASRVPKTKLESPPDEDPAEPDPSSGKTQ